MSYQAVIIDDNVNTVQSLKLGVDWEALGFTVAGTAGDGMRGEALIRQKKPDIVITDIMMPGQDGLSMIERLSGQLGAARVIVITGYDKFQYATQAIRLSVFDYILKPVSDDELRASLLRAKASLDAERAAEAEKQRMERFQRRVRLMSLLTGQGEGAPAGSWMEKLGAQDYFVVMAAAPGGVSQPLLQRVEYQSFPEGLCVESVLVEEELVLLCGRTAGVRGDWKQSAQQVLRILRGHVPDILLAVSALHTADADLRGAYTEARRLLMELSILGGGTREAFFGDAAELAQHPHLSQQEALCTRLVDRSGQLTVEQTWDELLKSAEGHVRYLRVLLMFYCTKMMQKKMAEGQWTDAVNLDTTVSDIAQIASAEQAHQWLLRFWEELSRTAAGGGYSVLVRNVLYHVNTYAAEGLRLEDVAQEFHVSPNYLSMLVRRETGKTYREHVIEAKMRVSKQLLDDTRMRVEEIAHAVGYENYISFYNMFRRMEGQTPSAYRMRNREES